MEFPTLVNKTGINQHQNSRITTFTFTSLLWVYTYFYQTVNGKLVKGVPNNMELYLTPLAFYLDYGRWF